MKTMKKLVKKVFGGRPRRPRRGKWHEWNSGVGLALVMADLRGRKV